MNKIKPRGYRVSELAHLALRLHAAAAKVNIGEVVETAIWREVDLDALREASIPVVHERGSEISWYITRLDDGTWASWDDADLDLTHRVSYHDTREEAVRFQLEGAEAVELPLGCVLPEFREEYEQLLQI